MFIPGEDPILADMRETLYAFYQQADSREAFQHLCEGKADEKGMPPDIKAKWVDFAMQVYDEMKK